MEEVFKVKLKKDRASLNRRNTSLSQRQYNVLVGKVLTAKLKKIHLGSNKLLLQKYNVDERNKLVVPFTDLYYIHDEELFEVLHETHLSLDHGNRDQMMKKLKSAYKNIAYKDIMTYLSLCERCKKRKVTNPTEFDKRSAEFNKQCLIDFIDYQTSPDGEYKFVMIYQELFTKFSLLKPLKSNRPEEVADNLINIFGILGPPRLLQSNNGNRFVDQVIDILKILWSSLEIKLIKSEDAMENSAQEVESMVTSWMRNNNKSRWSEGIRFVQLKRNTTTNSLINTTPYEALFKCSVKIASNPVVEEETEEMEAIQEIEAIYKEEPDDEEYEDENDIEVKQEFFEITKTEPQTVCGNCGFQIENDEDECGRCKAEAL